MFDWSETCALTLGRRLPAECHSRSAWGTCARRVQPFQLNCALSTLGISNCYYQPGYSLALALGTLHAMWFSSATALAARLLVPRVGGIIYRQHAAASRRLHAGLVVAAAPGSGGGRPSKTAAKQEGKDICSYST